MGPLSSTLVPAVPVLPTTNVVKHASATSISIVVTITDGLARTVIEDNGAGFAVGDVRAQALGLVGMRERAQLLGGRFDVQSSPGSGTTGPMPAGRSICTPGPGSKGHFPRE